MREPFGELDTLFAKIAFNKIHPFTTEAVEGHANDRCFKGN